MFIRTSRVKRFLRGCHRMRSRYRQMMKRMELGWRKRYAADRREIERTIADERKMIQTLIRRLSTIKPESYGHMRFGVRLTFDERMFRMFDATREKDLIRYWAQDVGHMLEREISQLNFARFVELEHEREDKEMQERRHNGPMYPLGEGGRVG